MELTQPAGWLILSWLLVADKKICKLWGKSLAFLSCFGMRDLGFIFVHAWNGWTRFSVLNTEIPAGEIRGENPTICNINLVTGVSEK